MKTSRVPRVVVMSSRSMGPPLLRALLLVSVAMAAGCGDAARTLASGPGGAAAASQLLDALRARYGLIDRAPAYEVVRPKLEGAALVPSRIFDDASVWTASEGEWRGLGFEGRGRPGGYRLSVQPTPSPPQEPGEYRGRLTLQRLQAGRFEWTTHEKVALGPLRPEDLSATLRAVFRAAEVHARAGSRPRAASAMPRTTRALGRLVDLEKLSLEPQADETARIEVDLRLMPDRLKSEAPHFAAYVARYSQGFRLRATAYVADGRPLWSLEAEDTAWRLRLRTRGGALVPLEGSPGHEGAALRVVIDYSFKAGWFRVGVRGLAADVRSPPSPGQVAFAAKFVEQPDWQLPFLVEPLMQASLRFPFEAPGSELSLAVRAEEGRSFFVTESRVRIRESWIVRWLGGFTTRALKDLRAAEAEADRYLLECLTAVQDDLGDLAAVAS